MRFRKLDRSITIQRRDPGEDAAGQPSGEWKKIHFAPTIPAEQIIGRGAERYARYQTHGRAIKTFKIRWRRNAPVTTDRIIFNNQVHDIHDVQEVGRKEAMLIDCSVRSDQA